MGKAVGNWEFVYTLSNDCTLDNTLKMFQYKLLHRTIPTNTFLYKCRLVETELCAFCEETRETILHLFCDCNTFILRIYWSFSIFFQKYLIKSFTWLNTISNFIKLFHVGPSQTKALHYFEWDVSKISGGNLINYCRTYMYL
jgi:hypothetical protein